jgi:hypothetical protein
VNTRRGCEWRNAGGLTNAYFRGISCLLNIVYNREKWINCCFYRPVVSAAKLQTNGGPLKKIIFIIVLIICVLKLKEKSSPQQEAGVIFFQIDGIYAVPIQMTQINAVNTAQTSLLLRSAC